MHVCVHTYIHNMHTHTSTPHQGKASEDTAKKKNKNNPLPGRKRVLTKIEFAGMLIMYFQHLELRENKFLLFKSLNLWHFAIVALVDKYRWSVCRALPQ